MLFNFNSLGTGHFCAKLDARKEGFYPFAVPDIYLRGVNPLAICRPLHSSARSLHRPPDALGLAPKGLTTLSFLVSCGKATLTTNALLPLLIAPFICHGQRSQTSPPHLRCSASNPPLNFTNKKRKYPLSGYLRFCWRRRRDSKKHTYLLMRVVSK